MQGREYSKYLEGPVPRLLRELLARALNQEPLADPES